MNLKEKIAYFKNKWKVWIAGRRRRYAAARRDHYSKTKGRHPARALGTATTNTQRHPWNRRPSKSWRTEGRFRKLNAFKYTHKLS